MPTFGIVQWNQGGMRRAGASSMLGSVVRDEAPSILLLQEPGVSAERLLRKHGYQVRVTTGRRCLTAFKGSDWLSSLPTLDFDAPRFGLVLLKAVRGSAGLAVWNIHLPSRLHKTDMEIETTLIRDFYQQALLPWRQRSQYLGCHEIVAGDFNLQPFAGAFSFIRANRCLTWASRRKRKASVVDAPLYNPSWSLLRVGGGVGGTYYHPSSGDGPWYAYDQLLMSPEIALPDCIRALTQVGSRSLAVGEDERPDASVGSDHFPVRTMIRTP